MSRKSWKTLSILPQILSLDAGGNTDTLHPYNAPWVLRGGSYSVALTSRKLNKCVVTIMNKFPLLKSIFLREYFGLVARLQMSSMSSNRLRESVFTRESKVQIDLMTQGKFWHDYVSIRLNIPKNSLVDVQRVVQYIDNVVTSGNGTAISQIAEYFGLANAGSVEVFLELSASLPP